MLGIFLRRLTYKSIYETRQLLILLSISLLIKETGSRVVYLICVDKVYESNFWIKIFGGAEVVDYFNFDGGQVVWPTNRHAYLHCYLVPGVKMPLV